MVAAVWSTLETYNIQKKACHGQNLNNILLHLNPLTCCQVIDVMMDNASNNDTLMEALELCCHNAGIEFSALAACL